MVRVEVHVSKEDRELIRGAAEALRDPQRQAQARATLRQTVAKPPVKDLKALLAGGPPGDLDLERVRDFGRDIEL
jgi:hypothetical protein